MHEVIKTAIKKQIEMHQSTIKRLLEPNRLKLESPEKEDERKLKLHDELIALREALDKEQKNKAAIQAVKNHLNRTTDLEEKKILEAWLSKGTSF